MYTARRLITKLSGAELRLALAVALQLDYTIDIEPIYQVGARIKLAGMYEFYRPDVDWKQAGPLIEAEWVAITQWLQGYFGPDWVSQVDASDDSVLVWFMRAIVGYLNPELNNTPFERLIHVD